MPMPYHYYSRWLFLHHYSSPLLIIFSILLPLSLLFILLCLPRWATSLLFAMLAYPYAIHDILVAAIYIYAYELHFMIYAKREEHERWVTKELWERVYPGTKMRRWCLFAAASRRDAITPDCHAHNFTARRYRRWATPNYAWSRHTPLNMSVVHAIIDIIFVVEWASFCLTWPFFTVV